MSNDADPIRTASNWIREGRREEARPLLARFLQAHPDSVDGWLLMSMCISGRQRQIDCLNQVLRLDPGHSLARSRLAKLTGSEGSISTWSMPPPEPPPSVPPFSDSPPLRPYDRPPPETPPPPAPAGLPPSRPRQSSGLGPILFVLLLIGLLCGGGAAAAFYYNRYLQQRQQQSFAAAATVAAFTLPPTWTPTATATVAPTPTPRPTSTPTPTPTPPVPNPTVLADMDRVETEVSDVRGLEPRLPGVPRFLLSKVRVRPVLEASFAASGGTRDQLRDEGRVLSALGMIKPTYDLYTNALNGLTDSLGGFYFPWNDELYVIGTRFSGVERFIFSHEYGHALVDQHFNLDQLGVYPLCLSDEQRCQAIRALVEGDATLVMNQWWEQYAGPQDYIDILNYRPPAQTLPEQFPPPYVLRDGNFPYVEGLAFVRALYARGNWARVNQAYDQLPESTEQILHPAKYFAGESPMVVGEMPLEGVLGDGWRRLADNSLGEWTTYLLLGYGADVDAQLPDATAEAAAAGWGGDRYVVYYHDETDRTVLAARWIWDTAADSAAFRSALASVLSERFVGGAATSSRGSCWEANAQRTCMFTSGREVLWLIGPDSATLDAVLSRFAGFN